MTTDVDRAIAELVAIGEIEDSAPRDTVQDLVVSHARSLDGLDECTGLRTLSLIGCAVGDYAPVSRLANLRVLVIENCDLTEAAWAPGLALRVAVVRRNRLRHGIPLLELDGIQSVDLTGNPLDQATRSRVAEDATDRLLKVDDDETAEANRELADADTGIVAYRREGALWACATGLGLTVWPEAGHVETTYEQLHLVSTGQVTPEELLGIAHGGIGGSS
jgi:hypothetical protein